MSETPEQLALDGFEVLDDELHGDSPRDFASLLRLDEETCRIGLLAVAEMRRILDGFVGYGGFGEMSNATQAA